MIRLRLLHRLSLVLVALTTLCIVAMATLVAWNLRNGFSAFLAERDKQELQEFAEHVSARVEATGNADALTQGDLRLLPLLRDFAAITNSQDRGPPPRPRPSTAFDPPPPPRGPPPRGPPPPRGMADRLTLHDTAGRLIAGRQPPPDADPHDEVAVLFQGKTVALLRLHRSPSPAGGIDERFLRSQYQTIAISSALLLALSVMAAYCLSRQLTRPLLAVQQATTRIAAGERDVHIDIGTTRSDEIGDVIRNINQMSLTLQRMTDARRRWIADISHELRTPLSVLLGEIEALLDGIRPITEQALKSLREETLRLTDIVSELHQLSLADMGALPCHPQWLDGAALVHQVAERFALQAQQRGLSLQVQPNTSPVPACWDARRMDQLLGNLVSNSLRYTDAPGSIVLQLSKVDTMLQLSIDDSAPGVPEADHHRLFDPLFRGDTARDREHGGSGLGLAICQAIAEAHHGHIHAMTSPLGGLRVVVRLPLNTPNSSL